MVIDYYDGLEGYTTILDRGWVGSGTGTFTISAGNGYNGTACFRLSNTDGQAALTNVVSSAATRGYHVRVKLASLPSASKFLFGAFDGSTCHIGVFTNTSGQLSLSRGENLTAIAGPYVTEAMVGGTFYRMELVVTIANSGGTATLYVNGNSWLTFSGDTQNGATAFSNGVQLSSTSANAAQALNVDYDDLVITDGAGHPVDMHAPFMIPNANGDDSAFLGSDSNSTDNYLLVDDGATADDDTTYVEASTPGNRDLYNYGAVGVTGTVLAVTIATRARKNGVGVAEYKAAAKSGGTTTYASTIGLGDAYANNFQRMDTKPGGGSWTVSDLDSAQFGIEVVT